MSNPVAESSKYWMHWNGLGEISRVTWYVRSKVPEVLEHLPEKEIIRGNKLKWHSESKTVGKLIGSMPSDML